MGARKTVLLIITAAILIGAYLCTFTVDEREQALVVRFGKINRAITEPGLYFKAPFPFDRVDFIEDRILFLESRDKPVQVIDSRRYLVDTITMYRIVDAQRFRETVQASLRRAEDRIETRLEAALKAVYGRLTFEAALSEARGAMMHEIRATLRPQALEIGIEIVDVRIRRTDLLPEVLRSTYDRMSAERLAEAAEIRAVGTERSLTIRAGADRQAVILVAEAQRDAEVIRGEGDAVRVKTFADAFTRDPEFYSFYRSMQAYGESLANSGNTIVLSPDSQFFEFFGNDRGAAAGEGGQ